MDATSVKGVVAAPLYTAVPCEQSTYQMACYMSYELGEQQSPTKLELLMLRWLGENNMVVVKRN